MVIAACIAAALLAGLGVKLWLDHRVPSPDADAGRLSRYMASPAFAALPDAQKAPYLDAFQRASDRGELTPEQQRGVISNVNNRNGKNPIQQYFSLPPGKEREKFLDDVIDRVLKARKTSPAAGQKRGERNPNRSSVAWPTRSRRRTGPGWTSSCRTCTTAGSRAGCRTTGSFFSIAPSKRSEAGPSNR